MFATPPKSAVPTPPLTGPSPSPTGSLFSSTGSGSGTVSGSGKGSGMLRNLLGRNRNTLTERQRLEALHTLHMTLLEPHHSNIIARHLASVHAEGRRSRVLDVGAGTGSWSVNLANSQPYCNVVAIDIDWSSWISAATPHGNLDCETVNVTLPLPYPAGHFDIIHVKALFLEVSNYPSVIERLAVTLRPGGMLILVDAEPSYLSSLGETSYVLRTWDACVRDAYAARQMDVTTPANLLNILSSCGVFATPAFTQEVGMPCAGFLRGDSQTLARAGRQHNAVIEANIRRMVPVVRAHGYEDGQIQGIVEACIAELCHRDSRHYQRLFAVYGTKLGA